MILKSDITVVFLTDDTLPTQVEAGNFAMALGSFSLCNILRHQVCRAMIFPCIFTTAIPCVCDMCRLPIGITGLLWLVMTMCVFSVLTTFFPRAQ